MMIFGFGPGFLDKYVVKFNQLVSDLLKRRPQWTLTMEYSLLIEASSIERIFEDVCFALCISLIAQTAGHPPDSSLLLPSQARRLRLHPRTQKMQVQRLGVEAL